MAGALTRMLGRSGAAAAVSPTYVGGKTAAVPASTGSNTNISLSGLTGGSDSSPAAGDLVIVAYVSAAEANVNMQCTTSGFTEQADLNHSIISHANLGVYTKIMTGTPDTQVTLGPTGSSSNGGHVCIHVWRGVDPTTPMDVALVTGLKNGSANLDAGAITPVTAGAVIVVAGCSSGNGTLTTASDLSNFIRHSGNATCAMGSANWSGSGAFNPGVWSGGSNDSNGTCVYATMALRPA